MTFQKCNVHYNGEYNRYDTAPASRQNGSYKCGRYTEEEKVEIAKNYLIPKQIENHGLKSENITFSEPAIRDTINYYTRESGVRNLERQVANVCRKTALKLVTTKKNAYRITPKNLEQYLGKKRYRYDIIEGAEEVGVTTGLAWTIVGGDTLFIETTVVPGSGKLVLTGQLGEVMQESAKARHFLYTFGCR